MLEGAAGDGGSGEKGRKVLFAIVSTLAHPQLRQARQPVGACEASVRQKEE